MGRKLLCLAFLIILLPLQARDVDFRQEEVTFESSGVVLSGTLTVPAQGSGFPALVMITGGGNRNRDAQRGRFRPFKLIAEYLSPRGIAVLRYDDRGIGKSTGEKSLGGTLDDFKDDALAAVGYLRSRDDLSVTRIGLMGHCAGVYAALKAASESKEVDFIVSMAGCGMSGEETILKETREVLARRGRPESDIVELQALRKKLFEVVRTDQGWEDIEARIREFVRKRYDRMSEEARAKYEDFDDFFPRTYDSSYIEYAKNAYIRHFFSVNPIPLYENFRRPILLLFGGKDTSVAPKYHEPPIREALVKAGNTDYAVAVIPEADHYFVKDWKTGRFAPGFLTALGEWLEKQIKD